MIKRYTLWTAIFIVALILNQTNAFKTELSVTIATYALWFVLGFISYVFYNDR